MINFSFENQGTNTYLVYTLSAEDSVDSMSLGMLTNNKIPGLAPVTFTQMDTNKFIKYNISAHVSVKQFFAGPVNRKRLIGVFSGIVNAMLSAEDYMIDINSIILDEDYIFSNVSSCETELICLPILNANISPVNLGDFFKNIMFSTQFDQTENCDHIAKIMNYLNSNPMLSLVDFKALLNSIEISENAKSLEKKVQPVIVPIDNPVRQPVRQVTQVKSEPQKTEQKPVPPVVTRVDQAVPLTISQTKETKQASEKSTSDMCGEKKISMFNLLMHYSKENAAAYKAQKEAKKQKAASNKYKFPTEQRTVKNRLSPSQSANNFGFAVPGQAAPPVQTVQQPEMQQNEQVPKDTPPIPVQQVQTKQESVSPISHTPFQVSTKPKPSSTYNSQQYPQGQPANFGETTVLGGKTIGETTVLKASANPAQMTAPHLIRKKNNEKISINKPVFRVGKERSYVDYFIGDNTAISRSHADFIIRDGKYFVVDTNSTNHTYVNGTMIQSNAETPIDHGDVIRLANEDFEFKLY